MNDSAASDRPRLKDGLIRRGKTWSYVIRVTDTRGVSRPRWVGGFPTEAAAKAARDAARVAARRGEYVDHNRITVEAFLTEWIAAHALEIKPKTRSTYERIIRGYVVPRIGRMQLQSVRPATLSDLYRELLESGGQDGRPLSVRSVNYVHAVLRKAFNDAVRVEMLLTSNPAERAKRPKQRGDGPPPELWTAEQLAAFLEFASEHRLFAYFRLAAYTGARRGELLNLRWADVKLGSAPSVTLRGTVSTVDGVRIEGSTKGGRSRTVSIDAGTVEVLKRHQAAQLHERSVAGVSWVEGDHVFRMQIGAPLHTDTPTPLFRKLISRYNQQARREGRPELPVIRLHDLRHLHATLLLKAGIPVHVVAHRLGHADPSITLRVYAHVLEGQDTEVAEAFATVMEPGPGTS